MNRPMARWVVAAALLGLSLSLGAGCQNQPPEAVAPIPDRPAAEAMAGIAQEESGPGDVLFAVMDLSQNEGSPVKITSRDNLIPLRPAGPHTYTGQLDMTVRCDADVPLGLSIAKIRSITIPGVYACALSVPRITAPGGTVTVYAKIDKVDLRNVPLGTKVAVVKLRSVGTHDSPMTP